MTSEELRRLQAPLKERYRSDAASAQATLHATADLEMPRLVCRVKTASGAVAEAGLHPMAGGDDQVVCAGNMLLEALAGCAGVTLSAVATAMGLDIRGGEISVAGDMDFRGTLGIDRQTPVGFTKIRVEFLVDSTADDAQLSKLAELTERYCVVAQSLKEPLTIKVARRDAV